MTINGLRRTVQVASIGGIGRVCLECRVGMTRLSDGQAVTILVAVDRAWIKF